MPQTFTVKQVADILGYSTNSIYTFLKEKRIKGVRVGKGRFRVPQAELDRLLQKKSTAIVATREPESPLVDSSASVSFPWVPDESPMAVPGLFDWVVVLSSMLLGIALPLVSGLRADMEVGQLTPFIPAISIGLFAGGLGLFLTKLWTVKDHRWEWIFSLIVGAAFGAYAINRIVNGDWASGILYVAIVILLAVSRLVDVSGVVCFVALVVAALLFEPLTFLSWRQDPRIRYMLSVIPWSSTVSWVWLISFQCIASVLVVWSTVHKGRLFQIIMGVVASAFVVWAFWLAYAAVWARSFLFLLLALFALLAPTWEFLPVEHRRDRRMVTSLFTLVLLLFAAASVVVSIFEGSLIAYARAELANKLQYGRDLITNRILLQQSALESLASNPLFVGAVEENDGDLVTSMLQSMYDATGGPRRVYFVSASGIVVGQYPLRGDSFNPNERTDGEYVLTALTTKQTHRTSSTDTSMTPPQEVIVIATPVRGKEDDVYGAIVAWIYADQISDALAKFTDEEKGEYFSMVDQSGRMIFDRTRNTVGLEASAEALVRRGAVGEKGVGEQYDSRERIRYLTAYDRVSELGWGLAVSMPVIVVLQTVRGAAIIVFSLLAILLMLFAAFLLGRRTRYRVEGIGKQDTS